MWPTQSRLTLWDPLDCSPPDFSVHGILQARILEWVAISFSRASAWPRAPTQASWITSGILTTEPRVEPVESTYSSTNPWNILPATTWKQLFSFSIKVLLFIKFVFMCVYMYSNSFIHISVFKNYVHNVLTISCCCFILEFPHNFFLYSPSIAIIIFYFIHA